MVYMKQLHWSVANGKAPVPGVGFDSPWARCQADAREGVAWDRSPRPFDAVAEGLRRTKSQSSSRFRRGAFS